MCLDGNANPSNIDSTWWAGSSWFSPANPMEIVEMPPALSVMGPEGPKVGGAQSQNRFAGKSHTPIATVVPEGGSPTISIAAPVGATHQLVGTHAHGPALGGAVCHSRFNDRKKPVGKALDGSVRQGSRKAKSTWRFNVEAWAWERTGDHDLQSDPTAQDLLAPLQRRTGGGSGARMDDLTRAMVASSSASAAAPAEEAAATEAKRRRGAGRTTKAGRWGLKGVGGLAKQCRELREVVELPLRMPRAVRHIGARLPRGVLIHGPPGTGKTMLARAVAEELELHLEVINGPEMVASDSGTKDMARAFANAEMNAPAVILLDEVDSMAPARDKSYSEFERRCCTQLLTLLDDLVRSAKHVVVIATTNRPSAIDAALRRAGRLEREIELGAPNKPERLEILKMLTRNMPLRGAAPAPAAGAEGVEAGAGAEAKAVEGAVDLELLAKDMHGYAGADIAGLAAEAGLACIREAVAECEDVLRLSGESLEDAVLERAELTHAHFTAALARLGPSMLRELVSEVPDVRWEDVGGLEGVKQSLVELVKFPVEHREKFDKYGLNPATGALLYGPPGCGKTLLAKAVASECGVNFISIKGPELLDKWLGESERGMRELFAKARAAAPCVVFFDELDSVAMRRGGGGGGKGDEAAARVLTQLLTELDGVGLKKDVFVIGATNRPELLDPAVVRPGRLDALHLVGLPEEKSRLSVLKAALRRAPLAPGVDLTAMAAETEGCSGADLAALCQRACQRAVAEAIEAEAGGREGPAAITAAHVAWAMEGARRSVSDSENKRFLDIEAAISAGQLDALAMEAVEEEEEEVEEGAGGALDKSGQKALIDGIMAQARGMAVVPGSGEKVLLARVQALEAALIAAGLPLPETTF